MTHVRFNNRPVRYDNFFNEFFNLPSVWNNPSNVPGIPAANVSETADAFILELNVPGRNKEDFKINLEKDLLTVSLEQKQEKKAEEGSYVRKEFTFNSFKRSFSLDERVDAARIQAKYDNGILKIELPKKEEVKQEPKQITVS